MDSAFRAIISGRVQMVMYRDFAQRKASAPRILGEVRNLPDGTVEVVAEGEKGVLERYLEVLKQGPVLARVDNVNVTWVAPTRAFKNFSIEYGS
jgi:acylphosphatase